MTIKSLTRLTTAIATGAVLLSTIAPAAFADSTLNISGNGSASTNGVTLNNNQTNTVVQDNNANVTNTVTTNSNTGNNSSNDNTGGSSFIRTGGAQTSVDINNQLNSNQAQVSNCGCATSTDVTVGGNGSFSDSHATVNNNNTANVFQTNNARVTNTVDTNSTTGNNAASRNTGGDTSIVTGPALTDVNVSTAANQNVASVGGTGTSTGGASSLKILGNGSESANSIALNDNNSAVVTQNNYANIANDVTTHAKTGYNDANDNTDGAVFVHTGAALTGVDVANEANFNAAALDCGCMSTVTAKEEGNGSFSGNAIRANFGGTDSAFQNGNAYLSNPVDTNSYTGANDENRNTGGVFDPSDPSLFSGEADSWTTVNNAANENVYGPEAMFTLPDGQQMAVNFNMGDVLSFFHMM